jgi:copper chaperone CopZ
MARWITIAVACILLVHPGFAAAQSKDATLAIPIEGTTCASCAIGVRLALRKVEGVKSVKVTSEPPRAVVTFDPTRAKAEHLVAAIEGLGYGAGTPEEVP